MAGLVSLETELADFERRLLSDGGWVPPAVLADVRAWLACQRTRSTSRNYGYDWRQYWQWAAEHQIDVYQVTRQHLETWRNHLLDQGQAPSSVNRRVAAMRSWQRWLTATQNLPPQTGPAALPTPDVTETQWLTDTETQRLIDTAEQTSPQHAALVWLGLHGLRRDETLNTRWGHLYRRETTDNQPYTTLKIVGKGMHIRQIRITDRTLSILRRCCAPNPTPDLYIIRNPDNTPKPKDWPNRQLKQLAQQADIPNLHPHMLRHTCAVSLSRAGATDRQIQRILGHKDIKTTETYLHGIMDWDTNPIERVAARWLQHTPPQTVHCTFGTVTQSD